MFEREISLIGLSNYNKIKNTTVVVIGLGGVGGYVVESLVRGGIGNLILIDYDTIDITNLNRQVIATYDNIGNKKVDEWKLRIEKINPECNTIIIDKYLTTDNLSVILDKYKIDYIVDACDTISVKMALISYTTSKNIKFISSMGTGNKTDASKLEITTLDKTSYDKIAKILRKYVKDNHITKKIYVVSSSEEVIKTNTNKISSISVVPSCAGILVSSYMLNSIINN